MKERKIQTVKERDMYKERKRERERERGRRDRKICGLERI